MKNVVFANPDILWFWLLIPLLIGWFFYRELKKRASFKYSGTEYISPTKSWRNIARPLPFILILASFAFLIYALARPRIPDVEKKIHTEGIDIVLALDISASMLAQDFQPDRHRAAIKVANEFIESRKNDRIGLVVFSGEAFTQCPITIDHNIVQSLMKEIKIGMIKHGTAIGMGLGTAVNRLKDSEAESKVIILLTDGVNNMGDMDPLTAADLAVALNIRVHTIGVGTMGRARMPVSIDWLGKYIYDYVDVEIDEELLRNISAKTGGNYYRATDNKRLEEIYKDIDALEKSKIESITLPRHIEMFAFPTTIGLVLLVLGFGLRFTILRSIF